MSRICDEAVIARVFRDPIHGYIRVTKVENRIIDSPIFARLANVAQMHSAHLVYPAATYSRKAHSLGAMHIAHRMITRILFDQHATDGMHPGDLFYVDTPQRRKLRGERVHLALKDGLEYSKIQVEDANVSTYVVQAVRLAALLHDIGHAPLSHLFETASEKPSVREGKEKRVPGVTSYNHEHKSADIVRRVLPATPGEDGEPLLSTKDAGFVADIIASAKLQPDKMEFLGQIINSPLDADKMDYILRDSHAAGTTEYGTIDLDRILESLVVYEGKLIYSSRALDAVVQALNAVFFMYNNVYLHDTVRAFDLAALDGIGKIHETLRGYQKSDPPTLPGGLTAPPFEHLDDASFLAMLEKVSAAEGTAGGPFTEAREALRNLRGRRKTLRSVFDRRLMLPLSSEIGVSTRPVEEKLRTLAERAASQQQADAHLFRVDLGKNIRPVGLSTSDLQAFFQRKIIFDQDTGEAVTFREHSPHFKMLNRITIPVRIYVDRRVDLAPDVRRSLLEGANGEVKAWNESVN